jgi:hypothetical protein
MDFTGALDSGDEMLEEVVEELATQNRSQRAQTPVFTKDDEQRCYEGLERLYARRMAEGRRFPTEREINSAKDENGKNVVSETLKELRADWAASGGEKELKQALVLRMAIELRKVHKIREKTDDFEWARRLSALSKLPSLSLDREPHEDYSDGQVCCEVAKTTWYLPDCCDVSYGRVQVHEAQRQHYVTRRSFPTTSLSEVLLFGAPSGFESVDNSGENVCTWNVFSLPPARVQ